ncbi:MAG: anthranilate synthase component I, partial [Methanosarcinales archaeon]|nr:anthranilate synthase component I [Methanosarcinales archaeon]
MPDSRLWAPNPDAVMQVKGQKLSLRYTTYTPLIAHIHSRLKRVCDVKDTGSAIEGHLKEGLDVLDSLRELMPQVRYESTPISERQVFQGGALGFLGFDIVYDCHLAIPKRHESQVPDIQLLLTSAVVIFDHLENRMHIVVTPFIPAGAKDADISGIYDDATELADSILDTICDMSAASDADENDVGTKAAKTTPAMASTPHISCNTPKDEFMNMVTTAKQHIIDGDIFQVVLSRRYDVTTSMSAMQLYDHLRTINPSPYMYLLEFDDLAIIGASPETLLTVHDKKLITNPIAGTTPRGKDAAEDAKLAELMMHDEKERAEHTMLVDLGRNDCRVVSKAGTVKVTDFMSVVKYSHVQHIESTVVGDLRDECDVFDATRAVFPAGTLSGAPKIRAMEIIDALEKDARGVYGGCAGYFSFDGNADFAIVIRTIILQNGIAQIQAGAGIVADSDPEYEY